MGESDRLDEVSDVEETEDAAKTAADASEDTEADRALPVGNLEAVAIPPPSIALLSKLEQHQRLQKKLRGVEDEKKRTAKNWAEQEKSINAQIDEVVEQIDELKWFEKFDPENGVVYRWNVLNHEDTETRAYEPPPQQELPLIDGKLTDVIIGQRGVDPYENYFVVKAVESDSVVIEFEDDSTAMVSADDWHEYASALVVEQPTIFDVLTEQWEPASDIAERAGVDKSVAAKELKALLDAGSIEAEGEKRGRKYRRISQ